MPLTVRLDSTLAAALERHCTERGVTRSLVVQESLAACLLAQAPGQARSQAAPPEASANDRAFAEAGLIGSVALGREAHKAAVRALVAERAAERKARQGGA